ncbi:MAG: hypothetical protein ACREAC_29525, partial [Blastocatellia bacterium]
VAGQLSVLVKDVRRYVGLNFFEIYYQTFHLFRNCSFRPIGLTGKPLLCIPDGQMEQEIAAQLTGRLTGRAIHKLAPDRV